MRGLISGQLCINCDRIESVTEPHKTVCHSFYCIFTPQPLRAVGVIVFTHGVKMGGWLPVGQVGSQQEKFLGLYLRNCKL